MSKALQLTKQIKFEGDCDELEAKYCFQRLSENFSFEFYVLIKSSNFQKQSFAG